MIEHHDPKPPDTKAVGRYEHTGPDRTGTGIDDLPRLLIVERDVTKMDLLVSDLPILDSNRHRHRGHGRRHDDPDQFLNIVNPEMRHLMIAPDYWEMWESEWAETEGVSQRISDWTLKGLRPGDSL